MLVWVGMGGWMKQRERRGKKKPERQISKVKSQRNLLGDTPVVSEETAQQPICLSLKLSSLVSSLLLLLPVFVGSLLSHSFFLST